MTAYVSAARLTALFAALSLSLSPLAAVAQEPAAPGEAALPEAASAAEAPATTEDYVAAVIARINSVRLNTATLRDAGITGDFTTRVAFTTGADGRLVSSAVAESSGQPMFDNIAMAQIRSAEPFPLFAPDMGDADRSFSILVTGNIPAQPEAPAEEGAEPPAE
ncbi:energy transducer TonB [Rhodobacter sp. 24-YEA-8]|uniref:energy transducer TonB n=1 Tax=Rhodobacter sp. 24-YEA-8 TaxID=1884310 RepID=UPI000896DE88|nr:energy transducer TonB [Rhodobacter sp. 24-YEA-8]SEC33515.1 TonB family C-terminal domain-containing protein [Rhodobacter sp. 24-YEA-8]